MEGTAMGARARIQRFGRFLSGIPLVRMTSVGPASSRAGII